MGSKMVSELVIPRLEGRAVEVAKGQTLRITAHEGKQVADLYVCNRHDFRERLSTHITAMANDRSLRKATTLMSTAPFYSALMTVTADDHGVHWLHGRCNAYYYKTYLGLEGVPTCHDNIVEALRPFGVTEYDVDLDTFNVFMVSHFDEQCRYSFSAPVIEKDDHIDMRAEMDLLVAISSCPNDDEINDFEPKALKVALLEP